jgi:purine-binding chemotaxis protein CheW
MRAGAVQRAGVRADGATEWVSLARAAAAPDSPVAEAGRLRELLVLDLAGGLYALPVECVREIVRVRATTPMPHVPRAVLGVMPLRGEMLQVVDLRLRLSLPLREPGRRARIVVVQGGEGGAAGLLVDAVSEVLRVTEDACMAPGESSRHVSALCTRGDTFVSILDPERVMELDDDES